MKIVSIDRFKICRFSLFDSFPEIHAFTSTRYPQSLEAFDNIDKKNSEVEHQERIFNSEKEWYRSLNIPDRRIARIRQVHGDRFVCVRQPGMFGEADGMVTDQKCLYLRIVSADCLPVFMYDPRARSIALVHAGWRGLQISIAAKAVEKMCTEFNSKPQDLLVAVGPFIHTCCYMVGKDIAETFPSECIASNSDGRYALDLGMIARNQLLRMEIPLTNIEISSECTCCRDDLFHSARRDKANARRNVSIMGLLNSG